MKLLPNPPISNTAKAIGGKPPLRAACNNTLRLIYLSLHVQPPNHECCKKVTGTCVASIRERLLEPASYVSHPALQRQHFNSNSKLVAILLTCTSVRVRSFCGRGAWHWAQLFSAGALPCTPRGPRPRQWRSAAWSARLMATAAGPSVGPRASPPHASNRHIDWEVSL